MSVGVEFPNLEQSERTRPFIIGVTGGTSSGKTSVCQKIIELLGESSAVNGSRKVAIISQDNFYKDLSPEERHLAYNSQYNFDHPDAFDLNLMKSTIINIANGKTIKIPEYDFKTHARRKDVFEELQPCDVVLFEGILVFYHQEVRDLFNMKLFVDSDADTRLSRRVLRDITERGRTLESVLQQYTKFVKPAFEEFCLPTKKYADVIIPRGVENTVAINLIVHHIRDILNGEILRPHLSNSVSSKKMNGYYLDGERSDCMPNGTEVNGLRKRPSFSEMGARPH